MARSEVLERSTTKLKEPRLYEVIILNDDITPMDFVVEVLMYIFKKSSADAAMLMMAVHVEGSGIAGVYPYDIAITKKTQSDTMAAANNFPLKVEVRQQ